MITQVGDNQFEAFICNANYIDAIIYNVSGQPVLKQSCEGDEITIDASSLNAGVYIISINNKYNQRILQPPLVLQLLQSESKIMIEPGAICPVS